MVQWLGICLPMQGIRLQSPVQEDPTGHLSPCSTIVEPVPESPCSATRDATTRRSPGNTTREEPWSLQAEKACVQQRRPSTDKKRKEREGMWRVPYQRKGEERKEEEPKLTCCVLILAQTILQNDMEPSLENHASWSRSLG